MLTLQNQGQIASEKDLISPVLQIQTEDYVLMNRSL
jgi:hypothetical protein